MYSLICKTFAHNSKLSPLVDADSPTTLTASYEYGAFGEPTRTSGDAASTNPYRFSTKYTDNETGLLYYGYRYYDSEMGRWLSKDPLGERGGANLYGFSHNSSIDSVDYLGMKPLYTTTKEAAEALLKGWKGSDDDRINALIELYESGQEWKNFYGETKKAVDDSQLAVLAIIAIKNDDKDLLEKVARDVGEDLVQNALDAIGNKNPTIGYAISTGDAIGSTVGNFIAESLKAIAARTACCDCLGEGLFLKKNGEYTASKWNCLKSGNDIYAEVLAPDYDELDDGIAKNVIDLIGKPEKYYKKCL